MKNEGHFIDSEKRTMQVMEVPSHLQMELTSWLKILVLAGTICGAIVAMGFHIGSQIAADEIRITALEQESIDTKTIMQRLTVGLDQLHTDLDLLEQHMHDVNSKFPPPQSEDMRPPKPSGFLAPTPALSSSSRQPDERAGDPPAWIYNK